MGCIRKMCLLKAYVNSFCLDERALNRTQFTHLGEKISGQFADE